MYDLLGKITLLMNVLVAHRGVVFVFLTHKEAFDGV